VRTVGIEVFVRSGNIWVMGSRQFKDCENHLACGKNAERTELNVIGLQQWIWAWRDSLWMLQSFDAKSIRRTLLLPR
jgi:hypothetical protein